MIIIYNLLLFIAAIFLIPYYTLKVIITGKYRSSIGPKLGFISPQAFANIKGSPRIWVHAVSIGEVNAAQPIVSSLRALFPNAFILLSTSTETGQEMARRTVPGASSFMYYPLDVPFVIRKVMNMVRPDIFIPVETELWPNFLRICKNRGVKIVMVNGRISSRSFKKYIKTRYFWKKMLGFIDKVGMISEIDADRVKAMGMDPSRISIMGNAKYDSLATRVGDRLKYEIGKTLNILHDSKVFVAGSTHEGEEHIVIKVYKKLLEVYPDLILIIVPRHIERSHQVIAQLREEGFDDFITVTELSAGKQRIKERIIIVDVIGELFKVYSLATVVYCGGSLVKKGGQNILEPAAWGKVVFYGPSMEDFMDEKYLLEEAGAGITVRDEKELLEGILNIMGDEKVLNERGNKAKDVVASNRGASRKYAELIKKNIVTEAR